MTFTISQRTRGSLPRLDSVEVWSIPLDRGNDEARPLESLISPEERARAERFHFRHHRNDFIVSHAAVRSILAEALAVTPLEIRFATNPFGKPELAAPWVDSGLRFNLSHANGLALCALANGRSIGVDLERYDRALENPDDLAARFFTDAERNALAGVPSTDRNTAFFRLWTRKEAFIKMIGSGLSMPLDRFRVSLVPDIAQALEHVEGELDGPQRFTIRPLGLGDVYAAAVATEGPIAAVSLRGWEFEDATRRA